MPSNWTALLPPPMGVVIVSRSLVGYSSMNKTEKFWDRLAGQFDKRVQHLEQPPIEATKGYLKQK